MGLFDGLFGKKDNDSGKSGKSSASYAPSVKGEPRPQPMQWGSSKKSF